MAAYPLVGALIGTLLVGLSWLLTTGIGRLHAARPAVQGQGYRPCWPPHWYWLPGLHQRDAAPGRLGRLLDALVACPSAASGGWR